MQFKYLLIAALSVLVITVSGCATPAPTATPTPVAPTATAVANASATPTVEPAPTVTPVPTAPAPTAVPAYSNGSPLSISNIRIDWDTTSYEGQAKETATMTVSNIKNDSILLDVVVYYKVSTPTTFIDPDGTVHNLTNTLTKTANVGMLQVGEHRDLSFQVDHTKNVPVVASVVVQWRGGSAVVFERDLSIPDNRFGTYEY